MTTAARPSYDALLATAADAHRLEMWRAAETVRAQVPVDQGREAMLDCLGLADVTCPGD